MRKPLTVPKSSRLITAEEYGNMPEEDGFRTELVRGRVIRLMFPKPRHAIVAMRISSALFEFVQDRRLGLVLAETGYHLEHDPDTVRGPDASFVSQDRVPGSDLDAFWPGAPDLAVEVLSPSNRRSRIASKVAMYFGRGGRLVWVISPKKRTLTIHKPGVAPVVLTVGQEVTGEDVIPGFRYPIARLFEGF